MKITDHVIERYSQRCMSIRDMITEEINMILEGVQGILYKDPKYGLRIAKPVETGVFICNKESTAIITFISRDRLSQKELCEIYRRR